MFTDRNGRPCQASDDSLVAAMFRLMPKNLEETVIFANEDEGYQELPDRLLAYISTKQSVKMSESKRQTRRDDPMGVDKLIKKKVERKSQKSNVGAVKGSECQNQSNVKTVGTVEVWPPRQRLQREKWSRDTRSGKSKGCKGKKDKSKGKSKSALNNVGNNSWQKRWWEAGTKHGEERSEGWWNEEHADGWWKDEQTRSSSKCKMEESKRSDTLGNRRTNKWNSSQQC